MKSHTQLSTGKERYVIWQECIFEQISIYTYIYIYVHVCIMYIHTKWERVFMYRERKRKYVPDAAARCWHADLLAPGDILGVTLPIYMRHDSFRSRGTTHSYVLCLVQITWHDSFSYVRHTHLLAPDDISCVGWLIHMRQCAFTCDIILHVTQLIHAWHTDLLAHDYVSYAPFHMHHDPSIRKETHSCGVWRIYM